MFFWETNTLLVTILTFVLVTLFYGGFFFVFAKIIKRKTPHIFLAASFILTIVSIIFNLIYVCIICSVLTATVICIIFFSNIGDLRGLLAAPFKRKVAKQSTQGISKIYDKASLYETIRSTVEFLSQTKTGALLTFERQTSLTEICKNGVAINAPVSKELLQTIFYVGTRLHDGAVVIHEDQIISAAVFFTPSTNAYAVKYGSRHRAAIGISEVSDSVTVVVSEETGRVAIAVNGSLETVRLENFLRVFTNYMEGK